MPTMTTTRNVLFLVVALAVLSPARSAVALDEYCGNGICNASASEDCWSCWEDCYGSEGCYCGDGECEQVEEPGGIYYCFQDCGECLDSQDCYGDECCGSPGVCCGPFEMCNYMSGECIPIPAS